MIAEASRVAAVCPCPSWSRDAVRSLTIAPKAPFPLAAGFRAVPDDGVTVAVFVCGDTERSGDDNGIACA
ncbi:hypothetical protein AA13594_2892 [Gluconacetobacter azotocaptans DSM 13594]|nr:hypothetical protein AA13594_2892 [Gluconacetobacter azotocaptans DSM 13594]